MNVIANEVRVKQSPEKKQETATLSSIVDAIAVTLKL